MTKNNEYVGVDDKFVPEGEKKKTHVEEPIIGSENAQKIRESITEEVNKLTSEEGKEKVKTGAKKGWKIAKGIGIGYLILWITCFVLAIGIFIFVFINISNGFNAKDKMLDEFNSVTNVAKDNIKSITEKNKTKTNLELHNGVNWRTYVSDDLEKIYSNNKSGEHLITVINNETSTTDTQEIRAIANALENEDVDKKYDITIEYDNDGYIKTYTFEEF